MIADLERARKLALNEKRLVVRHSAVALFASLVHTSICLFYYNGGYFAASLGLFSAIFGVIWAGNLALFAIVRSGVTLKWKDPSISMWFALWLTLGFLVTSYYVDAFRISVVMVYFGVMLLAAFRSGFWRLAGLSLVASLGYALVLGLVFADRSINLNLSVVLVCLGLALLLVVLQQNRFIATDTLLGILSHSTLALGLVC
ncbi:MAG: hypothetical protein ACPG43_04305, partial [Alcanivoracaceae bacterium]